MKAEINIHIFCCVNKKPVENPSKSCGRQNSEVLIENLKKKLTDLKLFNVKVTKTFCLGKCKLGPAAIIYPEGRYIHYSSLKDINSIISYLQGKNDINHLTI